MKKMRVCVVTGTRAEFGIWRPVLRAIEASRVLELKLVVTGMHLLEEFGKTEREIRREGFKVAARVPMYEEPGGRKPPKGGTTNSRSLARGIEGLAGAYREVGADVVLVLGDRLEMLAAASAALAERVPLAHLHGGETAPGIWDEQIRHAITKMAQVHFCATEMAGRRIMRMGEEPGRVHVVGAPALDALQETALLCGPIASKIRRYRTMGKRHHEAVILLHPSGGSDDEEMERAMRLLTITKRMVPEVAAVGPNNDPGHKGIIQALNESGVQYKMSMAQEDWWHRLAYASVLMGNSSSGIIEAATLGVPVVNIGGRQAGRERSGNVIDVGWNAGEIEKALRRAITDGSFLRGVARRKNVYGDGKASERIVRVLEGFARAGGVGLEKRFCD